MPQMEEVPLIRNIIVENLFGEFTYNLPLDKRVATNDNNLSLLYGSNGSGKTTLLRLIYSALSPNVNEGLRSYMVQVPFSTLYIRLGSGDELTFHRQKPEPGPYTIDLKSPDGGERHFEIKLNEQGGVVLNINPELVEFHQALVQNNLNFIFIPHNRLIRTTYDFVNTIPRRRISPGTPSSGELTKLDDEIKGDVPGATFDMNLIANAVLNVYRRLAFVRGRSEQFSTFDIYINILTELSGPLLLDKEISESNYADLVKQVDSLSNNIGPLLRIGAMAPVSFDQIAYLLSNAPPERRDDLARVALPFLESLKSRIESLKPLSYTNSLPEKLSTLRLATVSK